MFLNNRWKWFLLQELGRFHGTSLAMKADQPTQFDEIKTAVQELVYVPDAVPVFGASLENSLRMALMALEVSYPKQ